MFILFINMFYFSFFMKEIIQLLCSQIGNTWYVRRVHIEFETD